MANKLGVAEKGGCSVVVGVEEGERLLLKDKEDCVNEFEVFGKIVQLFESETNSTMTNEDTTHIV